VVCGLVCARVQDASGGVGVGGQWCAEIEWARGGWPCVYGRLGGGGGGVGWLFWWW